MCSTRSHQDNLLWSCCGSGSWHHCIPYLHYLQRTGFIILSSGNYDKHSFGSLMTDSCFHNIIAFAYANRYINISSLSLVIDTRCYIIHEYSFHWYNVFRSYIFYIYISSHIDSNIC